MQIESLKEDIVFRATLRRLSFEFHSTWGLFSPRGVDDGTRMLIESLMPPPRQAMLDLGCGYGAIGLSMAKACPDGEVHMVDKDFVALTYATRNAELNYLPNCRIYQSNGFSAVPATQFDVIASNLPANVGRELLSILLHDAKAHLKPGGQLWVVTIAGLRQFIRRNFEDVFGNYEKVRQGKTYTVALARKE
jgi:16S rRNA G1207 methylase RsmC